jgi:dCTP diphosphatase
MLVYPRHRRASHHQRFLNGKNQKIVCFFFGDISTRVQKATATISEEDRFMDSLIELKEEIEKFVKDRDWDQFHSPANIAKSISIEAGELLECFQWDENHYDKEAVQEELADVMNYCIQMGIALDIDLKECIEKKMEKNALKYPVNKCKGKATKYDKL